MPPAETPVKTSIYEKSANRSPIGAHILRVSPSFWERAPQPPAAQPTKSNSPVQVQTKSSWVATVTSDSPATRVFRHSPEGRRLVGSWRPYLAGSYRPVSIRLRIPSSSLTASGGAPELIKPVIKQMPNLQIVEREDFADWRGGPSLVRFETFSIIFKDLRLIYRIEALRWFTPDIESEGFIAG